jgi:hypothetical protein
MKMLKRSFCSFLLLTSISLNSVAFAQESVLPPELNQTSSLSEILAWLDKNSFPQARIGLNLSRTSDSISCEGCGVYDSAVFSQGFKLIKADGCSLTLRNEDIKILSFSTTARSSYDDISLERFRRKGVGRTPYPAELYIRLNRMKPERGKRPQLHTKDPAKAKLLGSWRTEFKEKGGRDVLLIVILDSPPGGGRDDMYGGSINFTFDSQEMSEQFNAAFRQAIKLCTTK